jgi:hypothetical protein
MEVKGAREWLISWLVVTAFVLMVGAVMVVLFEPTAPPESPVDAPSQDSSAPMAVARSLLPYAEPGP